MRHPLRRLTGFVLVVLAACSRSSHEPATPSPASRTTGRTTPAASSGALSKATSSSFADELLLRTNAERRTAKLAPLTRSINLARAAEMQAGQMARANLLEHDIPTAAHPTLGARLAAVQYPIRAAGENIGEGYREPAAAVTGWMASSGHRANILSPSYTEIGAAVAQSSTGTLYWVQVFGRPK